MKPVKLLLMFDRLKNYMGYIQFMMVGYLFITQTEFNLMTTILLVMMASSIIVVVDYRFIFPRYQQELSLKNPVTHKMLGHLERIESTVKEMRS